jgi:HEAT repeat protein
MRYDGVITSASILTAILVHITIPIPAAAQGTRAVPQAFSRGKSLADWMVQAEHYIPELRREAMKSIAALGPAAREALPVLVRASRDENQEVRLWAVTAIRRIGPAARDASPALLTVLSDDARPVQEAARDALEAIGPAATPVLLPALTTRDPWVRANAAEALGVIGVARGDVVPGLVRLLGDDSLWVRASAAWALGHLGRDAKKAAKPLAASLAEELRRDPALAAPGQHVRVENLVYALGRIGKDAGDAAPLVISVFFDGGDSLRSVAVVALAGIGSKAAEPLGKAVRSGPMPVRLDAARSLRLMGPAGKAAVGDLVKVLESNDELDGGHDLIIATADALGAMGKQAKGARSALEQQRRRSVTPDVVSALDRALRKIRQGG